MSWFDRRRALFGAMSLSAAVLAGCGFTPAYAPGGGGARLSGAVLVDTPDTRPGYQLTRHIEDRLGRASDPRYGLSYAIRFAESPIAISGKNVALRFNVLGEITYALRDLETGEVLSTGKVDNFTSYSTSSTTVATQAARQDAEDRLMRVMGDQMITRLIATAPDLAA